MNLIGFSSPDKLLQTVCPGIVVSLGAQETIVTNGERTLVGIMEWASYDRRYESDLFASSVDNVDKDVFNDEWVHDAVRAVIEKKWIQADVLISDAGHDYSNRAFPDESYVVKKGIGVRHAASMLAYVLIDNLDNPDVNILRHAVMDRDNVRDMSIDAINGRINDWLSLHEAIDYIRVHSSDKGKYGFIDRIEPFSGNGSLSEEVYSAVYDVAKLVSSAW